MPLEPAWFRKGHEKLQELKDSQKARGASVELIDEIVAIDEAYRAVLFDMETKKAAVNKMSKEVGAAMKAKTDASKIIAEVKELKTTIEGLEKKKDVLLSERDTKIGTVGNLVHKSVTVSKDEKDNKIEKTWGECVKPLKGAERHHNEILALLDGYETEHAVKMSGHRGYFLKGVGVLLNQALINYALNFLVAKGFTPLQPPYFMNKSIMAETAQLSDFAETLYRIVGDEKKDEEDKFLIATSEQPISAFHRHDLIEPDQLPLKYAGMSTCFRKEAGAYGKDNMGIFRIHQFEKIEQFVLTHPDKSWEMHEEMLKNCEDFYQSLGLPYRVVNIVSGELNNAAAKKYDVEAWFPTLGVFRELVSASNCTDYQSRAMQTKCGSAKTKDGHVNYVHMLNATMCATERTICCILENYQAENGLNVPKVLQPFMGGKTFLPFDEKAVKKAAAAAAADAKDAKEKDGKGKKDAKPAADKKKDDKKKDKAGDKKAAPAAAAAPQAAAAPSASS